jgi:hypothetical protein
MDYQKPRLKKLDYDAWSMAWPAQKYAGVSEVRIKGKTYDDP